MWKICWVGVDKYVKDFMDHFIVHVVLTEICIVMFFRYLANPTLFYPSYRQLRRLSTIHWCPSFGDSDSAQFDSPKLGLTELLQGVEHLYCSLMSYISSWKHY